MKINDIRLFSVLSEQELAIIEPNTIILPQKRNDILFLEGDDSKYLHILLAGVARVYRVDQKGNELLLHNFKAQSLIAELANFENMYFPASCKMNTDGYVAKIDFEAFKDLLFHRPVLSLHIIGSLTKKMKLLDATIHQNLLLTSQAKVAQFIYENEDLFTTQKQHRIASMLFMTPETLSRNLKKFKENGILKNDKNRFVIIDKERLKEFF